MWNPFDFTGKKVVVTGASSGIGRATAVKLSQQGAAVFIVGRNEERLKETISLMSGEGHRYYIKDLSEDGCVRDIYDDIVSDGSKIDGLVYCAGITRVVAVNMLGKKSMDESMTVNLYSFSEMAGLLSKKKYHNKASIVGISSIAARYPQKCQGAYVAAKAAMNAIVSSMAIELANKDIRINSVMPGSVNTEMLRTAFEGKTDDDINRALNCQVLGLSEPEDISDVIMFLLSDASRMITGREIYADGGYLHFFA